MMSGKNQLSEEERKAIKNVQYFVDSMIYDISAKDCKILLNLYYKEKQKNEFMKENIKKLTRYKTLLKFLEGGLI